MEMGWRGGLDRFGVANGFALGQALKPQPAGRPPLRDGWITNSVRRVAIVFLAAGGKQNRHHKDRNDDGNDHIRGRDVHGVQGSLLVPE